MPPSFLLVSNGPYLNRGCEAIVRGTVRAIEHVWGRDFRIVQGVIADPSTVAAQARGETDPRIRHVALDIYPSRFSLPWWSNQAARRLNYRIPRMAMTPHGIDDAMAEASVVFEVGGDNYSLHLNRYPPYPVVDTDRYIAARTALPIMLWGASVGPFDALPHVAREMFAHLQTMAAIMARETITYDYLRSRGVRHNVHLVADPAFLMAPVQPPDWDTLAACAEGAIGLNLSSLLAPFATRGDMPAWVELCATIVLAVLRTCRRQVLLVPHVTVPESDDHAFLMRVAERVRAAGLTDDAVRVLPAAYSAAELKFVISRLAVFVGARMHATIAALSSSVPTIGLTYSIKTVGVFRDFYGTDGYCIAADATTAETVAARVGRLMIDGPRIREQFLGRQVEWRQRALKAAEIVRTRLAVPGTTNGGNR